MPDLGGQEQQLQIQDSQVEVPEWFDRYLRASLAKTFRTVPDVTVSWLNDRLAALGSPVPVGQLIGFSTRESWTPTLTASTLNPTLGSGALQAGSFVKIGNFIHAYGRIVFGVGATPGTGVYQISLPVVARLPLAGRIGIALSYDSSATNVHMGVLVPADAFTEAAAGIDAPGFLIDYPATWPTGTLTRVSSTTPWTWAEGDDINFTLTYELG